MLSCVDLIKFKKKTFWKNDFSSDDGNKKLLVEIQALKKKVARIHTTDLETKKPQLANKSTEEVDGSSKVPSKNPHHL